MIIKDVFGHAIRVDPRLRHSFIPYGYRFSLFKYSERRWIDEFFENGSVKIGSLFEYHAIENGKPGQQDVWEGVNVSIRDGIMTPTIALNQWMFCTSKIPNHRLQKDLGGHGYEIVDIRFFLALSRELKKQVINELKNGLLAAVAYKDRRSFHERMIRGEFAGLIKRDKFSNQNEVRMLWEFKTPQEQNINYDEGAPTRAGIDLAIKNYLSRQSVLCSRKFVNILPAEAKAYCRRI